MLLAWQPSGEVTTVSSSSVAVELAGECEPSVQEEVRLMDGRAGDEVYPLSSKQSGRGRRLRQKLRLEDACR